MLPEKFAAAVPGDEAEIDRILGDAARGSQIILVAGLNRIGRPDARNAAVVFPPDGGAPREYDKVHMLPGFEDIYRIGSGPLHLTAGGAPAGIAICKDMDFPALTGVYGRAPWWRTSIPVPATRSTAGPGTCSRGWCWRVWRA